MGHGMYADHGISFSVVHPVDAAADEGLVDAKGCARVAAARLLVHEDVSRALVVSETGYYRVQCDLHLSEEISFGGSAAYGHGTNAVGETGRTCVR